MIDRLEALDQELMLYLNGFHNETMDSLMWLVSEKLFWIPVYLLILIGVQRQFGWKYFGLFVLGVVLTVTLCDRVSVELFKEVFQRYRPCHNVILGPDIHTVEKCGGQFGFVSSHACNYFGVATLSALWFRRRWMVISLMLWAGLIAYSRVYLGVHYPADILCGGLLGVLLGWIAHRVVGFIGQRFLKLPAVPSS